MPERTFGRTVRYRRTKLGLSQAQLGELVGRSPSTIRSWERDKSAPNETGVLHALSAILGIDERSLFEKAGQEPPPDVETSPTVEESLATLRPQIEVEEVAEPEGAESPPEPEEGESRPELERDEEEPSFGMGRAKEPPGAEPDKQADRSPEGAPAAVATVSAQNPEPGYVAPPEPYVMTSPTPPIAEPSYLEEESQRQLYRVRNLATLVAAVALAIALIWAVSESLSALGAWWDDFFGSLRL